MQWVTISWPRGITNALYPFNWKKRGPEHTDVASTLHNLGNLRSAMGNHQQAKEYYERALSIQLKKLGEEHTDVARTLHSIGNLHKAMGNYQLAKEYYECALSI